MPRNDLRSVTIKGLPHETHRRLDEIAAAEERSKNTVMLRLFRDWYEKSVEDESIPHKKPKPKPAPAPVIVVPPPAGGFG